MNVFVNINTPTIQRILVNYKQNLTSATNLNHTTVKDLPISINNASTILSSKNIIIFEHLIL